MVRRFVGTKEAEVQDRTSAFLCGVEYQGYCLFSEIRFIRSSLLSFRSLYPRSS